MAVNTAYEAFGGRSRALSTYKQMSIETATPAELVLMLYNRALRNMRDATECLGENDLEGSNRNLQKAQEIVEELRASLNMPVGGKIAQDLDAVYEYVRSRLFEANIKKDVSLVAEAAKVLEEIRDGWSEAVVRYANG